MILKAVGKYIDTLPLKNLLSQEESHVEHIIIEIDRYYNALDLANFTFVMRGITESGAETEVILSKRELLTSIRLKWEIGRLFTTESGKLSLDLYAYYYENPETDRTQNLPDYVLRYQLPPIEIRGLPDSHYEQSEPENSVTAMIQFREALTQLQANDTVQANAISSHNDRILELQDRIKIVVLTQAEYDTLENLNNKVLYVIKDEM